MSSNIVSSILALLLDAVNKMIALVLAPISAAIYALLPEVDSMFAQVGAWLNYATTYVGYVVDAFGIPAIVCSIVVLYYTFVVSSSFAVYAFKLGLKWYGALKP